MPIFDFECNECDKQFEKLVKPADMPPECVYCGSRDTQKKEVQDINFELKGIGVYKNGTQ
jgi:hypothetical protein